jgi:MFS family permease
VASVINAGPSAGMSADGAKVNIAFIAAIVAVATIGGFMFGYDSGVINGTQEGLEKAFNLSKLGTGLNVGAILLGCAFRRLRGGPPGRRLGPPHGDDHRGLLFLVSALGSGAAHTSAFFIVFRLIGGLGVGAASVLCPVYISEVTPANIRGRLSSVQQIMIITGLTGAFLANYVLAHTAGSSTAPFWLGLPAWRWMFWMQTIPAASSSSPCWPFRKARASWSPRARRPRPKPSCRACSGPARARPRSPRSAPRWPSTTSRSSRTCWTRRPARSARSCGPAWSWPCSSSSSASTSSSTTARCCGSRWASPRTTA